ncbi:hypothetical protein B0H14DRAFT_2337624, partial [Mycena olivaceomarginata]
MAGVLPETWKSWNGFKRRKFVAENPGPAAVFFDEVIKAFICIILAYDPSAVSPESNGLFGRCNAYYAMVEAQGRGTLHCHMLVWIEGNPSPQVLRDRMRENPSFQGKMFLWLESIISCELPSTKEPVVETNGELKPPKMPDGWDDPRVHKKPEVVDMEEQEFVEAMLATVEVLATKSNWHVHRETCWKYLKPGEPRNDKTCRMRITGEVNPLTHVDPETESIILRRLHPRINNYNQLVIFLLRCNMDIKYIGSGEAAKALIHYVTDYVTKSALATHIGLSAVEYAIKKNGEKFAAVEKAKSGIENGTVDQVNRSLFTKTVMALMSKQEVSHQQVMSYLVGGGDYYTSHTFKPFKWGEVDRYIAGQEVTAAGRLNEADHNLDMDVDRPRADMDDDSPSASTGDHDGPHTYDVEAGAVDNENEAADDGIEQEVLLVISDNWVGVPTVVFEYPHRSHDEAFKDLSLWEHEEWVTKVTVTSEEKR